MASDRPPKFTQALRPADARAGDRVKFECKVDGRPKPTVVWEKDGKVVSASSRIRIMEVYGTHSLLISRVEHTDNGVYSLTASNHIGSDSCSAQLHVQDMSSRGSSNSQLSGYGIATSGHSSPASNVSSPSISPKLGRAAASRLVSGSVSPFGAKSPTGRGGTGGGGNPPRRRGPGFILRPRPQTVASGESLCLKCTLLGHPKPTVTWEKDGELVDDDKTDGHIQTRIDGNDYYLEIEQCSSDDAGKYAVTARNSLGKQTAAVAVTVTGAKMGNGTNQPKTTKANNVSYNSNANTNTNANNNAQRHDDSYNNRYNSRTSEDERKPARATELILPLNLKPDDGKESPTGSISSTVSSHSRISTTSSRSNTSSKHDIDQDDEPHRTSSRSSWRRSNIVAPTFLRRLSSTQVLEGEELLLQCEVSGEPDPRMSWLRNGIEVGIDEDEVFTSFRNGVARLRLRDVHSRHAGEYVCKAHNEAGTVQCSSRVTIKVKRVQLRPHFTKSPSDVRATEGETVIIETEVEGVPTPEIVWSLDGEEVSGADASFINNLAKLVLRNVTPASSGQYMCSALNASGEDSVACRVRVKQKKLDIPPEFTAPLSDISVSESDDVCLRCMVTGIPEPTVKWMYNEEILEAEEGIEITFHDGVAALTLEQATEEDTGLYTCVAVNPEGQSTTTCKVMVKTAPKPEKKLIATSAPKITSPFDEYIRTQEGDSLTLECSYSGYPEPKVSWTVNDKNVDNGKASYEDGKAKVVISPINSTHGGHIKCTVENVAGKATHEARLYVRSKRVAPAFEKLLPESVDVAEGSEAYFECKVTGHPQPRVSWTRDGRSLSVLSTETSYEDGVASVRIRKAGPRDSGRYICTARNLSGEAESVCNVTLALNEAEAAPKEPEVLPPKFSKELSDITLNDGQDLRLECDVTGTPEPKITWDMDGHKLDPQDGDVRVSYKRGVATLALDDVMPEDTGVYRCVAENSGGKVQCTCRVEVKGEQQQKQQQQQKPEEKAPTFAIALDDQTVKEGKDIFLKCQIQGTPQPKITWLLDGEELTDAEVKYTEDGSAELLLRESVPEDEGVYTCIAENPLKRVMSSCKVTIEGPPPPPAKKPVPSPKKQADLPPKAEPKGIVTVDTPSVKPSFIEGLKDCLVQDGSTDFTLSCRVSGNPTARWFIDEEEIEASDDFKLVSEADIRSVQFAEIFPDDSGTYTCLIENDAGTAKSSCQVTVQEIDGDAPTFLMKPKPVNVNVGERAIFACRVDGDPAPTVQWLFCNRPVEESDRLQLTEADNTNNYTYSLEIAQVAPQDAGRYSVCCRNLLGDVTCTVSLIVSDAKKQEARKDFRDVLKKAPATKTTSNKSAGDEQVDFRHVLRSPSTDKDKRTTSSSGSEDPCEDPTVAYKEALQISVRTKALTEEERKMKRAEQKDFRGNLVRKVETKVTTQDALRTQGTEQLDFRDEALKTRVRTKVLAQDDLKIMHAEQKDFRSETIKSKVVTKAYREDALKVKRAEQVDFRNVLSPTKKEELDRQKAEDDQVVIANLPKAKWKKEKDHTTVATRRTRHRGPGAVVQERKVEQTGEAEEEEQEEEEEEEKEKGSAPNFTQTLEDKETKDGEPFDLMCKVTADPEPKIIWHLEEEEIKAEADITIKYEDGVCSLSVAECFPEDQGKYTCTATNDFGEESCSCYVTVLTDEPSTPENETPKFKKKAPKVSKGGDPCFPATIKDGPKDCTVFRGNPISLCCALGGTGPLKVVWRKGRNEIKHSSQCNIETSKNMSALTIRSSQRDDSGCYTLQLMNAAGVDQYSVSVKVVDAPDPPGKPFAEMSANNSAVVSWYGSGYDGGSSITSYVLEMTKLQDSNQKERKRWTQAASTKSTSHTVSKLEKNAAYMFRVSARNQYGLSKPGPASDIVRNLVIVQNGAESSDEEDGDFVKYGPVAIKHNEKFSAKYETREKLGQGRFGKVHRVVDRATGKQYAAKIMRALKAKDKEAVNLEIEIMNHLRHPKLVQLIDAYNQGREVTMVMDLVAGGELFERVIDEDFELTEAACIKYMRQICAGVRFMHDSSILHLDLKPENIMCINKTGTQIKLIDFGLARKFNPKEPIRVMFGTPEFVAPEVINYETIGFQTDMWSVGVICYILLSGLSPFSGDVDSETLSNITAAQWDFEDEAFDQISDDAKDFISHLLVHSLKSRFTVEGALGHKWLKNDIKKMSRSKLDTRNLKRFLARRKWQKTGNAVRALGRLAALARLGPTNSSNIGQQRESGFLSSLKAQLVREKDEEMEPEKRIPEFIEPFDDIEVIEGSAARFQCIIVGKPDPEIMWYKDGQPLKETRHFRISYTEDDVCSLLITEATEADEAEYTCKAINSEGETTHNAELIVITPGV
ncbi:myosin light chain kinase, smooth muscle-like isoform X3 [Clavelina lepadiformis]